MNNMKIIMKYIIIIETKPIRLRMLPYEIRRNT